MSLEPASTGLVRSDLVRAQLSNNESSDIITVRNLQLIVNAGKDVWGREKEQPALVTVTVFLNKSFDSAAKADSLDTSTIHYGILSKNVRRVGQKTDWLPTMDLLKTIADAIPDGASETSHACYEVDVFYPKGTMLGDGAGLVYAYIKTSGLYSLVLYLRNLRIPCLVGINSNERMRKQPVVVSLQIECVPVRYTDEIGKLEQLLIDVISETSFETLESLSDHVVKELCQQFFGQGDEGAYIRLRIEKPQAVPFADAPAVEILRRVRTSS